MPFDIKTQLCLITFIEFAFLLQVFEHKEARPGKVCPVRLAAPLLIDLKTYATTIPDSTEPYLFLTHTGNFITPSVSVKIRVITKLPNSKQSSKGTVKTHKYIQTDKISQQPENWENRNDPDLVQAFPKKWWVESDFTAPNLPLSLRLKCSGCHYHSI